jgi:hypothetical protein
MRISLTVSTYIAAILMFSSESRAQSQIGAILIGSVIGTVTKTLIDAALLPAPEYRTEIRHSYPRAPSPSMFSYSYAVSDENRSGVQYNRPCSALAPCGAAPVFDAARYMPGTANVVSIAAYAPTTVGRGSHRKTGHRASTRNSRIHSKQGVAYRAHGRQQVPSSATAQPQIHSL